MLGWVRPRSEAANRRCDMFGNRTIRQQATRVLQQGEVHVSDHPTESANAGVSHGREDHPTTEPRPQQPPPPPPANEPPTTAFAGFRTERRFSEAVTRG